MTTPKAPGEKMRPPLFRASKRVEQTPLERAREMMLLELAQPGSVLADGWRTANEIGVLIRGRIAPFAHGDVETALDYLVIRGLAEQRYEDAEVGPARPQRYRAARRASRFALSLFALPSDRRQRRGACPGCGAMLTDGLSYCGRDCAIVARRERDRRRTAWPA